jgi:hypothetical protein
MSTSYKRVYCNLRNAINSRDGMNSTTLATETGKDASINMPARQGSRNIRSLDKPATGGMSFAYGKPETERGRLRKSAPATTRRQQDQKGSQQQCKSPLFIGNDSNSRAARTNRAP